MVEAKGCRQRFDGEDACPERVVCAHRLAVCTCHKNRGNCVPSWIACRVGIAPKERYEFYVESGLLLGFPPGCISKALAVLHKASWDSPTKGGVLSIDKHDAPAVKLDDDIHGRDWRTYNHKILPYHSSCKAASNGHGPSS